ncbi:hypothetical protein S40285_04974 [Stachybotrys chlorohalonatus IBT 40285]|uniref:Uncharacterized protein n=1 Tax=Stachybotrys chlorohalonatus (strain IBT 40285) TaxID=1283841 RepID=A0A084QRX4_STAC4|nr:hypothetical protein S40285_04974 [Stachybotrys chlorohalonata IBT 40285]
MVHAEESRRRFAPVPIETTFQSVRKGLQQTQLHGPNPELTPEPSPRSPSPIPEQLRERRRFAPQLIESSRRTRRVGDPGPTTRPTDKTDITPYTKHIYTLKTRNRRKQDDGQDDRPDPPTRRETEEDHVKEYLLELAAKEAERQIQEAALDFFPNSRAREGGVAHFYFQESSESEGSPEATPQIGQEHSHVKMRRKSSELDLGWWQKHMQEHAENLAQERVEPEPAKDTMTDFMRTDSELDRMDLSLPPDPLWTTTNKRAAPEDRGDSMASVGLYIKSARKRDIHQPVQATDGRNFLVSADADVVMKDTPPPTSVPLDQHAATNPSQKQGDPSNKPFGGFGTRPEDPSVGQMRKAASPPMLGKDLTFRRCPSPKFTKLEPEHALYQYHIEERTRDVSGQFGLWRGYCFKSDSTEGFVVPSHLQAPAMLATPLPPATPHESYFPHFDSQAISEEPISVFTPSDSGDSNSTMSTEHRSKNGEPRGVQMLHGLEDRLRREKVRAERDEKIAQEFDDAFVSQVYNYLSLGYPATARAYDEELCKISHVELDELQRDDEKQLAKGYIVEPDAQQTANLESCPRWRALRTYIMEWARQHPNLDNLDPLAWGVRERRGSWAI